MNQTRNIADAVQTLEVLSGFQDEFVSQSQVISEMHRSLMEISLMESTLTKVSRMMKPLVELGNLRRLNEDELRSAARLILDQRTATRLSKNSTDSSTRSNDEAPNPVVETPNAEKGLVPIPDDAE